MSPETGGQAVLLAAHGSRVPASNAEIAAMANRLASRLAARGGPGPVVAHAFLEMAEPSIPDALDALAGQDARHIVLIPYFLAAGRHVREDIPAIAAAARDRHPGLEIELTDHFGGQEQVAGLLAAMVPSVLSG